ncbi:hypothetical protein B0H11DRAFT_2283716 [Mycena galericulata]|nr:hypothetical protein B0H11DRAFT_2283716 [Mycena galericulata]
MTLPVLLLPLRPDPLLHQALLCCPCPPPPTKARSRRRPSAKSAARTPLYAPHPAPAAPISPSPSCSALCCPPTSPSIPPRRRHPVEILFNAAYHASAMWSTGHAPTTYGPIASMDACAVSPASSTARSSDSAASCAPASMHVLYLLPP